ncbi:MAG: phage holin family protein [Adhaeribacter sp.]
MGFIIRLLLTGLAAFFIAQFMPGIHLDSWVDGIWLALVLALLNAIVRPVLVLLTIPITFLTLGLFLLVINVIIIYLADAVLSGFDVTSILWALIYSLVLAVVTSIISSVTK